MLKFISWNLLASPGSATKITKAKRLEKGSNHRQIKNGPFAWGDRAGWAGCASSRRGDKSQRLTDPATSISAGRWVEFKVALRGQRIACSGIEDEEQVYLIHHQYKLLPHVLLLKSRVILVWVLSAFLGCGSLLSLLPPVKKCVKLYINATQKSPQESE